MKQTPSYTTIFNGYSTTEILRFAQNDEATPDVVLRIPMSC
jgi:hypothetical protein